MEKNSEIKSQLHRQVDGAVNSILKSLRSVFDALKIEDKNDIEETNNLQISSNTNNISNELSRLLEITQKLKIQDLKTINLRDNYVNMKNELPKKIGNHNRLSNELFQFIQSKEFIVMNSLIIKDKK